MSSSPTTPAPDAKLRRGISATRTSRSIGTFAMSLLFTAVSMVCGLIATPLLLKWLGDDRYGAFRAASDWLGYLALLELGLSAAVLAHLTRAAATQSAEIRKVLVEGGRSFRRVMIRTAVAGVALVAVMPWLVPVPPELRRELWLAAAIMLLPAIAVPLTIFRLLQDAMQRGYWTSLLLICQTLVITVIALLLAYSGWGITGQAVATVLGMATFVIGTAFVARRLMPGAAGMIWSRERYPEKSAELAQLSWPSFGLGICYRLTVFTENIVVAQLLGAAAVVPLFATQRLTTLVGAQVQAVSSATWAGLAELYHSGQTERFQQRVLELTKLTSILATAGMLPIVAFNADFVRLWVGAERFGGTVLNIAAATAALLVAITTFWNWVLVGAGKHAALLRVTICATLVYLILSITLTATLGVAGPALAALTAAALVHGPGLVYLLKREMGFHPRHLIASVLPAVAVGAAMAVFFIWIRKFWHGSGWLDLIAHFVAAGIVYLLVAWTLLLRTDERREWIQRSKSLITMARSKRS